MMSFRLAAILIAIVCAILFAIFLFAPGQYIQGYGVIVDNSGLFIGRRAAPLLLGLAALLWLARDTEPSKARDAICWCVILTFAGIALTGIYAYICGGPSSLILLAAVGEFAIAFVFFDILRNRR